MTKSSTVWKRDTDNVFQEEIFDPSLPIQTRDGKKAILFSSEGDSLIAFVEKGQSHPSSGGIWALRVYNVNGKYFGSTGADSCVDLINCPPTKVKKEGWVNIHRMFCDNVDSKTHLARQSGIYKSRKFAVNAAVASNKRGVPLPVATVKIEWEEEQ